LDIRVLETIEDLKPSPIEQFDEWFQVVKQQNLPQYNAMTLATADKHGVPSARVVLLKDYGASGFTFYTNYNSQKGQELLDNPNAALVFYWEPLGRQVRIQGEVSRVTKDASDAYFQTRPKGSQINAVVSKQSQPLTSTAAFEAEIEQFKKEQQVSIECPSHWGGYLVSPTYIEFWVNGIDRAHHRFCYIKKNKDEWYKEQRYP